MPLRLFEPGYLSRRPGGVAAEKITFAALDLETTGLDPRRQRICEVAVVRFTADGTIVEEYATLVDPQRTISTDATDVHHIEEDEIEGAPTFAEIYPDLLRMLEGCVVVAHNLLFEDKFLAAEIEWAGHPLPHLPGVCSMVATRAQLDGPTYALQSVYRTATGSWAGDAHTALGDCRALATLVPWLLHSSPTPLTYHGPRPATATSDSEPGRIFPRAERLTRHADGYLGALAKRFPSTHRQYLTTADAAREYADALDEILDDHRITNDEGWRMERLARRAGFTQQQLIAAHRAAWDRAVTGLPMDSPEQLTLAQRRKLTSLAHDIGDRDLAAHIAPPPTEDTDTFQPKHLRTWRIGIDGDDNESTALRALVESNGGSVAKRLTKTVQLIAAAAVDADTRQLSKARELGIRIVTTAEATATISAALKTAEAEYARREQENARWEEERAQRLAEDDAYFRHTWRTRENPPRWEWNDRSITVQL